MTNQNNQESRIEMIWGTKLLDEGFTPIPNLVLRYYRALGIEHGEWGLICMLMSYKHDHRNPYPHQETLAEHLNVSVRQIRKWTTSLEAKNLLKVERRVHRVTRRLGALVYDFTPLIQKALELSKDRSNSIDDNDFETITEEYDVIDSDQEQDEISSVPEVPVGSDNTPKQPEHEELKPPEPQVPLMNRSENRSTTNTTNTQGMDNAFQEIEFAMMQCMGRQYIATRDDYLAIKRWIASQVPLEWLVQGVHRVFQTRPDAKIRSFKYVSTILEDDWAKELAKTADVQPFEFKFGSKSAQNTPDSRNTMLQRATQRDERYTNFYALFPDA